MSSAIVRQDAHNIPRESFSAYVEEIPNIPELNYWNKLEQFRKTQPYFINYFSNNATWISDDETDNPYDLSVQIEPHINTYLNKAYFVDANIAQLIDQHLDDLF